MLNSFLKGPSVLLLAVLLSACSAERSLEALSTVSADNHYDKTGDIVYGPDARQKMDYYVPVEGESSVPESGVTVVFVYGGAWRSGSRGGYEFVASSLTKAGHRVLIPDYRLYPQVQYPDFIDDVAQAIAALESSELARNSDSSDQAPIEKLVLMGHSSGAHQAALLLTDPRYFEQAGVLSTISGFIGISGPYDLPLDLQEVAVVFPDVKNPAEVNPVLQARAMAPDTLSGIDVMLLHGEDDERVLPFHTERFAEALKGTGASVTVQTLDAGHAGAVLAISGPLGFLNDSRTYVLEILEQIDESE